MGLAGLRIHDLRHSWASQGVMNGVGLTTVRTCSGTGGAKPSIYANLDDGALYEAASHTL